MIDDGPSEAGHPVPFELQPRLTGSLVELKPLRPEDHDALYAVARDPLIWEQHPVSTRHEDAVFRAFFAEALASGGAFLVTDAETRLAIGSSRFHGYNEAKSVIEIGWTFLARSHWGGRHNAEMKHLMLRHAFRFVESVVFLVGPENTRSRKAMERIGGVLESGRSANGNLVYRITASAFAAPASTDARTAGD
jgi:RimJ/RimL family protein N-acetyltransferase